MNGTFRVGRREVWVDPETHRAKPAFLKFIWEVNRLCDEANVTPIFGEPTFEQDTLRDWEHYPEADVIHIRGEQARKADPTIRIVARSDFARQLFDQVEELLRPDIALIESAHVRGMSKREQQMWIDGWKGHNE